MISLEDAQKTLADSLPVLKTCELPLEQCLTYHLAKNITAEINLPAFDSSSMDGYAVNFQPPIDLSTPFQVINQQTAGLDKNLTLQNNQAIRIFTGAPLPKNTTAIVQQEITELNDSKTTVTILESIEPNQFIRPQGQDSAKGQLIATKQDKLTPSKLAIISSQGISHIEVFSKPSVSIVTTGNELKPIGTKIQDGEIYNSNSIMLTSLLQELGIKEIRTFHANDTLEETEAIIEKASQQSEIVITSGGVSVGDHDHVRKASENIGYQNSFWKVAIMPGKPFLFSKNQNDNLLFGLPGNPVSSFVTFHLLVAPAIRQLMGSTAPLLPTQVVTLKETLTNKSKRKHFMRGKINRNGEFESTGLQQSHIFSSLSKANALVAVENNSTLEKGTTTRAIIL